MKRELALIFLTALMLQVLLSGGIRKLQSKTWVRTEEDNPAAVSTVSTRNSEVYPREYVYVVRLAHYIGPIRAPRRRVAKIREEESGGEEGRTENKAKRDKSHHQLKHTRVKRGGNTWKPMNIRRHCLAKVHEGDSGEEEEMKENKAKEKNKREKTRKLKYSNVERERSTWKPMSFRRRRIAKVNEGESGEKDWMKENKVKETAKREKNHQLKHTYGKRGGNSWTPMSIRRHRLAKEREEESYEEEWMKENKAKEKAKREKTYQRKRNAVNWGGNNYWKRSESRAETEHKHHLPRVWDNWGTWSKCSVTCGIGKVARWRHCISGGCMAGEKEAQLKTCTFPAC